MPESDYEKRAQKDRERAYERKAAGALQCRLSEEGGRLKREGKLRGAEEAFARARKARRAYLGLCRESYLQLLDDLSRAGWAGKYYADRIKGMDADIDQMRRGCAELRAQGKRQAAEEIIARRWQVETQRRLLIEELGREEAGSVLRDCCIEAQSWLLAEVWDGEDRGAFSLLQKKRTMNVAFLMGQRTASREPWPRRRYAAGHSSAPLILSSTRAAHVLPAATTHSYGSNFNVGPCARPLGGQLLFLMCDDRPGLLLTRNRRISFSFLPEL